jgi:peptide/nickel transport system permease protein
LNFIQRRVLTAIVAFAVTVNLIFIIPRLVPGSAAAIFAAGSHVPAVAVILISKRLGLDQPLPVQYELYLKGLFATWPPYFGVSYEFYPEPVTSLIASRLPWTLLLLVSSLFLAFSISYTLATVSAMRRGGKFEFGSLYASIFFWSIPGFWIGMILIWVFSVSLKWFPVFGTVGFNTGSGASLAYAVLTHAILPVITLTLVIFGQNYMLLRGAAQEVLNADYVNAAKARGLKGREVASSYVMRNSMLPVMSLMGYSIASIISAEILIEAVYSYGGVGDLIVDAIVNRDYPVIEGSFFFVTVLVIVLFVVGDFLMLRLDPRLKG